MIKVIGIAPGFFSGLAFAGDGTDFGGQPFEVSGIEKWVVRTVSPGEDLLLELIQNLGVGGLVGEIVKLKGIQFQIIKLEAGRLSHQSVGTTDLLSGGRDDGLRIKGLVRVVELRLSDQLGERELVVRMNLTGEEILDQLESIVTDGPLREEAGRAVSVILGEQVGAPGGSARLEKGLKGTTRQVRDRHRPGCFQKGRHQVDGRD